MRSLIVILVAGVCLGASDSPSKLPLTDMRFSVHTLVREDIFAGILEGDMDRFSRGEQSIDFLLEKRPQGDKPSLLAWKAGALLFRGILALEAKQMKEFEDKYAKSTELVDQARKLGPNDQGAIATMAGMHLLLADRLPENKRAKAWATAYDSYQTLWKGQERIVDKLPPHMQGSCWAAWPSRLSAPATTKSWRPVSTRFLPSRPTHRTDKPPKSGKKNPRRPGTPASVV